MYSRSVSGILTRKLRDTGRFAPARRNFVWSCFSFRDYYAGRFRLCRRALNFCYRDHGVRGLAKACTRQFEFILEQRVRRTIQIFHLYSRIWGETAFKELLKTWRRRLTRNSKDLLFGATLFTGYNWEKERISDKEMYSYCHDIDDMHKLKDSTVMCSECNSRLVIDVIQPNVKYCQCKAVKSRIIISEDEWTPFLEKEDMLVWRKIEPNTDGLYAYKIYGSFADVSAEDFLQVQIDVNYRKEWDETAKELIILETDPSNNNLESGTCDVIYWEMIWPTLFANRDYVYQRRWIQDEENGVIIIISKVTEHPDAPVRPDTHRVSTYWSYMVIKPYNDLHESGIEFGLTYFDDPGVNIPNAITTWVAMRGFPDYLCRMREATKCYKTYKMSQKESTIVPKPVDTQNNSNIESSALLNEEQLLSNSKEYNIKDEQSSEMRESLKEEEESNKETDRTSGKSDEHIEADNTEKKDVDENIKTKLESPDSTAEENQSFLSFFFLTRLFA